MANGWHFRDLAETWLWRQSNKLVSGEKVWEAGKARDQSFTCAKMFWWYNMYTSADWSATPRPMYPADGRKIPDHYAFPAELHDELDEKFGQFLLFKFWGPAADISSSRWFSYYYWLDDARAPDYSKTVDIHRKPGYDPVELFVDPGIKWPMVAIGSRLVRKKLGFRMLMDVISNNETQLVKGSHGRPTDNPDHGRVLISSNAAHLPDTVAQVDIKALILKHVFG